MLPEEDKARFCFDATNDFCALPMETWYNFRQLMSRKVLNLEEAEELMKNKQDRLYET